MNNIEDLIFRMKKNDSKALEELIIIWRKKEKLSSEEINLINNDLKDLLDKRIMGGAERKIKPTECITIIKK